MNSAKDMTMKIMRLAEYIYTHKNIEELYFDSGTTFHYDASFGLHHSSKYILNIPKASIEYFSYDRYAGKWSTITNNSQDELFNSLFSIFKSKALKKAEEDIIKEMADNRIEQVINGTYFGK